jgi:calcium-dependent protein kinase
MNCCSNQFAD